MITYTVNGEPLPQAEQLLLNSSNVIAVCANLLSRYYGDPFIREIREVGAAARVHVASKYPEQGLDR